MKAIILAAGYATRLYPLTLERPKALLDVCGRRLLDYIMDEIEGIDVVDEIIIVTNEKFHRQFLQWKESAKGSKPVTIVNDGSTDEDNRLGAIGDINYLISTLEIEGGLLVVAGDNIFTFDLQDAVSLYQDSGYDCVCVAEVTDTSKLKSMGVVIADDMGLITDFEEKPDNPKSSLGACPVYIYTPDTIKLFKGYIESGHNPDAPGHFVAWLHRIKPVLAYKIHGECYDIGTHEAYKEIQEIMSRRQI